MSFDDSGGLLGKAVDWIVAALAGLIGLVWTALHVRVSDIKKTADAAVPRQEWLQMREATVKERDALREDIKQLFNRDDALKDHINNKIDALRNDMHDHFHTLMDKISQIR